MKKKRKATKYSISSYEPELSYERNFEASEGATVKIKKYFTPAGVGAAAARRQEFSQTVRKYEGKEIEELFYVVDNYKHLVTDLQGFTEADLVQEFAPLLGDETARREWTRLVAANGYPNTEDGFDQAVVDLTAELVQDQSAKETFLIAVQDGNFKKPRDVNVHKHTKRFCMLIEYADRLPSNGDNLLTELQKRRYYGYTFPELWRAEYVKAGRRIKDYTIDGIKNYMQIQERVADANDNK